MKISNSKKKLAEIIHENGGWREKAESAAQCAGGEISFWYDTATKRCGEDWRGSYLGSYEDIKFTGVKLPNWHQTILSRDEYFHLYPVAEAAPEPVAEVKPTIEQLAGDYRNAKDYAERKQQEADSAKAEADAKLKALELAGEALGLLVSPITEKQGPELVITDWRDLQAGDVISVSGKWWEPDSEYTVDENDGSRDAPIRVGGYWALIGECSFKFIRRP